MRLEFINGTQGIDNIVWPFNDSLYNMCLNLRTISREYYYLRYWMYFLFYNFYRRIYKRICYFNCKPLFPDSITSERSGLLVISTFFILTFFVLFLTTDYGWFFLITGLVGNHGYFF